MTKRKDDAQDALDRLIDGSSETVALNVALDDTPQGAEDSGEMLDELDELDDSADSEAYDDAEDAADGGDDEAAEGDVNPKSDTHGAFDGRHKHGKFGMHSHDGNGDHADAALAMSEGQRAGGRAARRLVGEGDELTQLREERDRMAYQLYEYAVDKQLSAWGGGTFALKEGAKSPIKRGKFALTRALREAYRAYMLSDGIRLNERGRERLNALLSLALSNGVVDLSARSAGSYDGEGRMVGGKARARYSLDESDRVEREAERIALAEYHMTTAALATSDPAKLLAVYERAQSVVNR